MGDRRGFAFIYFTWVGVCYEPISCDTCYEVQAFSYVSYSYILRSTSSYVWNTYIICIDYILYQVNHTIRQLLPVLCCCWLISRDCNKTNPVNNENSRYRGAERLPSKAWHRTTWMGCNIITYLAFSTSSRQTDECTRRTRTKMRCGRQHCTAGLGYSRWTPPPRTYLLVVVYNVMLDSGTTAAAAKKGTAAAAAIRGRRDQLHSVCMGAFYSPLSTCGGRWSWGR